VTAAHAPELRQLRHFLAAAEEGSFARGASRLGVSPQAVAATTSRLERQLGRPLFLRHGPRGLELTPAGVELLAGARDLVERASALERLVRASARDARGRLRVGLFDGGAGPLTSPILRAFAVGHPGVAVSVQPLGVEQTPDLLERRVDVAVVLPPLDDPRVHVEPLLRVPRVACVPFASDLADADVLTPDVLLDRTYGPRYPWETTRWEGQWSLTPERNGDEPRRLRPDGERTPAEQFMRLATHGAVIVLPALLAPMADAVGLRPIPVAGLPPVHLALACLPDAPPEAFAFIGTARETARTLGRLVPGGEAPPPEVIGDPGPASAG